MVKALAVIAPPVWIARTHELIGLGPFPEGVVVPYLARSASLLYALHGAVLWGLSSDVVRYRPLIFWLGWLAVLHGLMIFVCDQSLALPVWWQWIEGPSFASAGVTLIVCAATLRAPESSPLRMPRDQGVP